jgi:hypothetical protein
LGSYYNSLASAMEKTRSGCLLRSNEGSVHRIWCGVWERRVRMTPWILGWVVLETSPRPRRHQVTKKWVQRLTCNLYAIEISSRLSVFETEIAKTHEKCNGPLTCKQVYSSVPKGLAWRAEVTPFWVLSSN